jgi:hypothetical protein
MAAALADGTRGLKGESRSGRRTKTDLVGSISELLRARASYMAIYRRLNILKASFLRVPDEEL